MLRRSFAGTTLVLGVALVASASSVHAFGPPRSPAERTPAQLPDVSLAQSREFCGRTPRDVRESFSDARNAIAFLNPGGYFNYGLCWWHSSFHRFANYLAIYRPELPRPQGFQKTLRVWEWIQRLKQGEVTAIDGYANLFEFTADPEVRSLLTQLLSQWQVEDTIRNPPLEEWLRNNASRPEALARILSETSTLVEDQDWVVFWRLNNHLAGRDGKLTDPVHAGLVIGVESDRILTIDSLRVPSSPSSPAAMVSTDRIPGQGNLVYPVFREPIFPFIARNSELGIILKSIRRFCDTRMGADSYPFADPSIVAPVVGMFD